MIEIVLDTYTGNLAGVFVHLDDDESDPSLCLYPPTHCGERFEQLGFFMAAIMETLWCNPEYFNFTKTHEEMHLRLFPVSRLAYKQVLLGLRDLGFRAEAASFELSQAYETGMFKDLD